jgi:hypothetical protein
MSGWWLHDPEWDHDTKNVTYHHVMHLPVLCPSLMNYLALPPGAEIGIHDGEVVSVSWSPPETAS